MEKIEGIMNIGIQHDVVDKDSHSIVPDLTPEDYLKLSERDNGQGIAPDVIEGIIKNMIKARRTLRRFHLNLS
jgi:hypothetical protein